MSFRRILYIISREAFKVFDANGDGLINRSELSQVMANLGEKMSAEETEMMMKEVDKNGDGVINYEEFIALIVNS